MEELERVRQREVRQDMEDVPSEEELLCGSDREKFGKTWRMCRRRKSYCVGRTERS